MVHWSLRVLRRHSLERRLFNWLLPLLLLPALLVVAVSLYIGSRSVEWIGTLGPWDEVAQSGSALISAAAPAAATDTALASALRQHQQNLSTSVTQARRWSFIGQRVVRLLPISLAAFALLLFGLAYYVSRRLARELAKPIRDLVRWAGSMAEGEPLPASVPRERREIEEVRALRNALRTAALRIAEARAKALELERVRAWGEMARRVAHEMKNPLTPLRLAVHRIARVSEDERLREPLTVLDEETGRLEELARQFAVLGRPSRGPRSDIDVSELLRELLATDVPPDIGTELTAHGAGALFHGHYDALQRAFRNLVRNAVEAIEIRRAAEAGRAGLIAVAITQNERELVVLVRDNGCGIPADSLQRIFEPDFTLKAGGTGLGLAVVRQAVLAHDGRVRARVVPDGGAELEVWLPVGRAPNLRGSEAGSPPAEETDEAERNRTGEGSGVA